MLSRRILALALGAILTAACDPQAEASLTPIELPAPAHETRTKPQPDGSVVIEASSAQAAPNQPYRFQLVTHCGITTASFDFDGSYWAVLDGPAGFANVAGHPPPGMDDPTEEGVIILTAADRAAWRSRNGILLILGRGPSETQVFGCD